MKKTLIILVSVFLTIALLCTGAFAQGGPQQGGGQPKSGGQPQDGNQPQGDGQPPNDDNMQLGQDGQGPGGQMNVNIDAITNAIGNLDDDDTAAALTALLEAYQTAADGDDADAQRDALQALRDALSDAGVQTGDEAPLNFSNNFGREYGRFLDVDAVADAIGTVTDDDTAASLSTLLAAYQTAIEGGDPQETKDALDALLSGLSDAQVQVDDYTGLQLNRAAQGMYLDTDAVAEAIEIAALTDSDTAATLTTLLTAYTEAVSGGDLQATQEAFAALMDALADAGVQV